MAQNQSFQLVRYFTRTSLIMISIVTLALVYSYRSQSINTLINYGEQSNEVLTRALSNTIWPEFSNFAPQASKLEAEQLKNHPRTHATHEMVLKHIQNTPVLKIKIFDLHGKTIFSTDDSQVGVVKPAGYPGSISARTGEVISKLSHRDTFKGTHRTYSNVDVVSSYVPIIDANVSGDGIAGVFEVYFDVTTQFNAISGSMVIAVIFIISMLSLLFIGLYIFVRRADRIIYAQRASINSSQKKYAERQEALRQAQHTSSETQSLPGTIVQPAQPGDTPGNST